MKTPNAAVDLVRFALWTLRDEAAQRRLPRTLGVYKMAMSKLIGASATLVLLLCSFEVLACDCAATPLALRIANSEVVMVAEVTNVVRMQQVTVKPIENFKGQVTETETIPYGYSMCDYFLAPIPSVGERYLLFLGRRDGKLVANRCYMPGPLSEKEGEVEELRKLKKQDAQQYAPGDTPKAARP